MARKHQHSPSLLWRRKSRLREVETSWCHSREVATRGPGPPAARESPPSCRLQPGKAWPRWERWVGGVSAQSPVRGKQVVRSQSSGAPRPSWGAWCFALIPQHAPWRRPAGCRALQTLSTRELKELAHSVPPQDPQLGPHSCLRGPVGKQAGKGRTSCILSGIPLWDSGLSRKTVWVPLPRGGQGCRLLGLWVQTLGRAGEMLGDERGV